MSDSAERRENMTTHSLGAVLPPKTAPSAAVKSAQPVQASARPAASRQSAAPAKLPRINAQTANKARIYEYNDIEVNSPYIASDFLMKNLVYAKVSSRMAPRSLATAMSKADSDAAIQAATRSAKNPAAERGVQAAGPEAEEKDRLTVYRAADLLGNIGDKVETLL